MQKLIGHLLSQFREFYRGLTPIKRASIIASAFAVAITGVIIVTIVLGTNYVPLFTNVPSDQLPQVVKVLEPKLLGKRVVDLQRLRLLQRDRFQVKRSRFAS